MFEYFLVFLGAAIPWLEIALVIPLGIISGLSPVWVMILAFVGNMLTVLYPHYCLPKSEGMDGVAEKEGWQRGFEADRTGQTDLE